MPLWMVQVLLTLISYTFLWWSRIIRHRLFFTEGTPFVGGCFRLKLVIPREYPNAPPRGFFLTKIYHPNVADNGDICVNTLKKDWTTEVTLKHIFQVIRCLLIVPFPESSLNCEAGTHCFLDIDNAFHYRYFLLMRHVGKLFMESYDEFARRARIMTEVHALPPVETTTCDTKMGLTKVAGTSNSDMLKQSASQKKEKDAKKKSLKRLWESMIIFSDYRCSTHINLIKIVWNMSVF